MTETATETTVCPIDAYENATQARDILNWVEAISWAASKALKNGDTTRAQHFAGLGQYLAHAWSGHFEYEADSLSSKHGIKRAPTA